METNAYFDNIHTHIIQEFKKANSNITIAVTWLTDNEIFQALCHQAKSGITVRLALLDDDINRKKSGIQFHNLTDAGGELYWIRASDSDNIMRFKFCIIDHHNVITGSYSWMQESRDKHENIVVVSNDSEFAMQYLESFNTLLREQNYLTEPSKKGKDPITKRVALLEEMIKNGDSDNKRLIALFLTYRDLTTKTLNRFYPWDSELLGQLPETWDWWELSRNAVIKWDAELIERYKTKWHWQALSSNEIIPWNATLIERYKDRWDWVWLSSNKALPWTIGLIERYKDRWDWDKLSSNKNLQWDVELIERYKHYWNWERLSCNEGLPWSVSLLELYQSEFLRASEGSVLFWTTNIFPFFQPISRETVLEICKKISSNQRNKT